MLAACLVWCSLPARAADHLDGVVPLVRDDIAAVARLQAEPGRHAMLYFGDHLN
jgi:hypothetical protein